ncbi:MAG: alpha/beta hydrolase [Burkholderiales bacterium]|uniref:alpha/beta hydrolase n=1 Tax=Inhella sp. TaxID=1921806 RepID=UPI001AC316C3|nr:alpha/beta hydrolase [Burkholderiales bacterium]
MLSSDPFAFFGCGRMGLAALCVAASTGLAAAELPPASGASAASAPLAPAAPAVDLSLLPYAQPDVLARLPDQRLIHLRCVGRGSPTVLLLAGLGDWSIDWKPVHERLGRFSRTCAWDRAGFGFSSGSLVPQTVQATTADLWDALRAAQIPGPYLLVGHSYGGIESIALADQHRDAVVGMVLVDPSVPGQDSLMDDGLPALAAFDRGFGTRMVLSFGRCRAAVEARQRQAEAPVPPGCLRQPAEYPPALAQALAARALEPARWAAGASLMERFDANAAAVVRPNRDWGALPLIVLMATRESELAADESEAVRRESRVFTERLQAARKALAKRSKRGSYEAVPGAGHYIQVDQPEAVIRAVQAVLALAR